VGFKALLGQFTLSPKVTIMAQIETAGDIVPETTYLLQVNSKRVADLRTAIGQHLSSGSRVPAVLMQELSRREDLLAQSEAPKP
jgi:hypothetical protein